MDLEYNIPNILGNPIKFNKYTKKTSTHHFVVDFMKMDLAHFVDYIFTLKCDESKT